MKAKKIYKFTETLSIKAKSCLVISTLAKCVLSQTGTDGCTFSQSSQVAKARDFLLDIVENEGI